MSDLYRVRSQTDAEARWDNPGDPQFVVERRIWDFFMDIIPYRSWEHVSRLHSPEEFQAAVEKDMRKRRKAGHEAHRRNSFKPIYANAYWLWTQVQEFGEAIGVSGWKYADEPDLKITIDTKG